MDERHRSRQTTVVWYAIRNVPYVVAAHPLATLAIQAVIWSCVAAGYVYVEAPYRPHWSVFCVAGLAATVFQLYMWGLVHVEDWRQGTHVVRPGEYERRCRNAGLSADSRRLRGKQKDSPGGSGPRSPL